MPLRVLHTDLHILNMFTRMPFRYGIATLTALPHVFLRITLEIDGSNQTGIASEGLAPKWFTKVPEAPVERELLDMLEVIRAACDHATAAAPAANVFDLWRSIYAAQASWADDTPHPPLLANLGVSLVERAVIDAFCKARRTTFAQAVRDNTLGIDLASIHKELATSEPKDFLPPQPARSLIARHTIGLSDPLTDDEIAPDDRLSDGLAQSLEACIKHDQLTHFKIKIPSVAKQAIQRMRSIANVLKTNSPNFQFTLDGNEFFREVDAFREHWRRLLAEDDIRAFFQRGLLFVEQPLHRDIALTDHVTRAFDRWPDRPAMIIDESDGELASLRRALACGYVGTSHKNCKGVFKGIANACFIQQLRRVHPDSRYILSGEDLANVGPVALLQDLAVVATLGLSHVERNGHHYFAGLSAFPQDIQQAVIAQHPDLYHWHTHGQSQFPSLTIHRGRLQLDTVINAPFGCAIKLDTDQFTPAQKWRTQSLAVQP